MWIVFGSYFAISTCFFYEKRTSSLVVVYVQVCMSHCRAHYFIYFLILFWLTRNLFLPMEKTRIIYAPETEKRKWRDTWCNNKVIWPKFYFIKCASSRALNCGQKMIPLATPLKNWRKHTSKRAKGVWLSFIVVDVLPQSCCSTVGEKKLEKIKFA